MDKMSCGAGGQMANCPDHGKGTAMCQDGKVKGTSKTTPKRATKVGSARKG